MDQYQIVFEKMAQFGVTKMTVHRAEHKGGIRLNFCFEVPGYESRLHIMPEHFFEECFEGNDGALDELMCSVYFSTVWGKDL